MILLLLVLAAVADTVRIGLFVGNNIGFGEDEPLTYAEGEARDMARIFQEMGDLSRDRTILLQGVSAAEVRESIYQVEAISREAAARGDEVMLIFFYSGHASADGLHLSGNLLPMAVVRRWLESSTAQVRIAFVDACESGTLARSRGGTPVEAIDLVLDDSLTMSGLAIITSTGPVSVARESASFGGGIFTRSLLNGLRGSADADSDGRITLDEAYTYAFEETVVGVASVSNTVQRPEKRYEISGVGSVVLTRLPQRAAGLMLPEELEGVYTVVSVSSGQVVARVEKSPGESRRLALPAGRYVVRKVRREDALIAEVDLVWGGDRWIDDAQMGVVSLGDPLARGGWNVRPVRVSMRSVVSPPLTSGSPALLGVEGELRYLLRPGLSTVATIGYARGHREEWTGRLKSTTTRFAGGVMLERHLPRLDLMVGAGPQVAVLSQRVDYLEFDDDDDVDAEVFTAVQVSPGLWLSGGLHLPLGPVFGLEFGLRGNLYSAELNHVHSFLVDGQAYGGLSASFGGRQIARAQKQRD